MEDDIIRVKTDIIKIMKKGGIFMNNIVGSKLRGIADKHGVTVANRIVADMKLEKLIGISPSKGED